MIGRHRSVGIRLTEQGASFVELESVLGRIRLLRAGSLDINVGGQADGTGRSAGVTSPDGQERPFAKADQVILGIPRRDVMCRFIEIPNVDEEKLEGLLAFEMERHVPFPVEEACYSYRKISSNGSTARVLIMAAKRTVVEEALGRMERLGIIPTVVDVSSMAAATALLYRQGVSAGQTVTLVQVEPGEATVDVLFRDTLVSSRTLPLGGGMVMQRTGNGHFSAQTKMADEKSQVRPLSYQSVGGPGEAAQIKGPTHADAVTAELKRVATVIEGSAGPTLLHGGDDSLVRTLRDELGTPVDRWDTTPLGAEPGAFGLALRGFPRYAVAINLMPPERRLVRKDPVMMLCRSLLALVACLSGLWWASDALLERRVLDRLNGDVQQLRQEASAVTALQQEATVLSHRLKALEELASSQGRSMRLLWEVVTLLPPDVLLQEFSFDGAKVRLRGSTTASAALLISAFERSVYLENAAFTAPISVQGKDRQAFEIAATMRAVPRPPVEKPEEGAS